ncbi:aminotransferase class V-fold PLP-dependent enzyme [Brachybacterium sp. GPGPB12]|uniref:aminotransferase class V-fold PLP-dependent enzyme n=1 Tax=Brachybacterium sp. GPGPB12 TaxID=3023517 RepID=UPI003134491E
MLSPPAPTSSRPREPPVDPHGVLRTDGVEQALADSRVGVLSAALVNNETGAVQDIAALAEAARAHGTLLHTDAVQAAGHVALPGSEDVDLMSLSGHKIGAPVGVGVLVARPGVPFAPTSTGGGQRRGVRSGTLDAAQAAAFAAALEEALAEREQRSGEVRRLAARLRRGIAQIDPSVRFTPPEDSPQSGHILHLVAPGADSDAPLFLLDERGIDSSAGSACSAGVTQASPVLAAMGVSDEDSRGARGCRWAGRAPSARSSCCWPRRRRRSSGPAPSAPCAAEHGAHLTSPGLWGRGPGSVDSWGCARRGGQGRTTEEDAP